MRHHEAFDRYPWPSADPVQRLRHTVAVYAGTVGSAVAVQATQGIYPGAATLTGVDGGDTGLTHHDLRRLLHLIEQHDAIPEAQPAVVDAPPLARLNPRQLGALEAVAEGRVVHEQVRGGGSIFRDQDTASSTFHPQLMNTLRSRGMVTWDDGAKTPVVVTDDGKRRLEMLDG